MKSKISQTNSLINLGDIIIIKTPLPINKDEITILGYEIITQDIVDLKDWVAGYFAISPISKDSVNTINTLNWILLDKGLTGKCDKFIKFCSEQIESYYLYFKFQKVATSGQIINITKVNLKIQDSDTLKKSKENFPYYYQSIFKEDSINNEEILTWHYNVLNKISNKGILPNYIERDKDFSIFWGWITHFFAIIVHFGRKFKKIFENYTQYLDLIGDFFKQKDIFQDSRIQINQNLKILLSEEIKYNIIPNISLVNGYPVKKNGYFYSDYIFVQNGNILIFKLGGYNKSIDIPNFTNILVNLAFYYKNYSLWIRVDLSMTLAELKSEKGKRYLIPEENGLERICYVAFSYPQIGNNSNLPLYLRLFIEGEGAYYLEEKNKEEIFNVYKDFKKRGTNQNLSLIKTIFETKKEDGFYADYLENNNIGWFLNKSCPINKSLVNYISIDTLKVSKYCSLSNGIYIEYINKYLILNQNTSFKFYWQGNSINTCYIDISIYTKNGEKLNNLILGNWKLDNNILVSDFNKYGVKIKRIKKINNVYEIEFPILLIDNVNIARFGNYYNKGESLVNNNLYLISKNINSKEAYYLKINGLVLCNSNEENEEDIIIGYKLNKTSSQSPITVSVNINSNNIQLKYDNIIISEIENHLINNQFNLLNFKDSEDNFDYGDIVIRKIPNNLPLEITLSNPFVSSSIINNNNLDINSKSSLELRKLFTNLGFLNLKQYFLCCYVNNGLYSNDEAQEIIDQKILPYNGYRLFFNNELYKNDDIIKSLELDSVVFKRETRQITIKVKGGVAGYTYFLDNQSTGQTFDNEYNQIIDYGNHIFTIKDRANNLIKFKVSCQPLNDIDYKLKVKIDIDNNINADIYIFGGIEESYTITYQRTNSVSYSKIVPAKNWINLDDIYFTFLYENSKLLIQDNNSEKSLSIDINALFKNIALDIYDIGEGEIVN